MQDKIFQKRNTKLDKSIQIEAKSSSKLKWKLIKTQDYQKELAIKAGKSRRQLLRRTKYRKLRFQLLKPIVD